MRHSPVRKLYSTVSKSITKPGRKIGAILALSAIGVRERADDVSCLREQGAQSYANTYVDRQIGKPIKNTRTKLFDWTNISWSYTPSTEYINTDKYI